MSEIESSSRSRLRHPPRRFVVALAVVATALLSGAAYAGYVLTQSDNTYVAEINCAAGEHSGLGDTIISLIPADKGSPTAACARVWREQSQDTTWRLAATAARIAARPDQMIACSDSKGGGIWVFPTGGEATTCAELGRPYDTGATFAPFSEAHPNGAAELDNYVQLRGELDSTFHSDCIENYDEAAAVARKLLDKYGYTTGTVTPFWEQWPESSTVMPRCAVWETISDQPSNIIIAVRK